MNDTPKIVLALMALCVVVSASAQDLRTVKIATGDLDLSTIDGVQSARVRILVAARRLCLQLEELDDLSHHANYLECVDQAVDSALHQIGAPTLAKLGSAGERATR